MIVARWRLQMSHEMWLNGYAFFEWPKPSSLHCSSCLLRSVYDLALLEGPFHVFLFSETLLLCDEETDSADSQAALSYNRLRGAIEPKSSSDANECSQTASAYMLSSDG
jgi:hypothetical protein